MTRLSVNINKVALLRNAREGNIPNVIKAAKYCEKNGVEGITVHPRPDERHIKYQDVLELSPVVKTEFNIEGYPSERWMNLVKKVKPDQATLVPDRPGQLTSDHGWNTVEETGFLKEVKSELDEYCGRLSLFVDPVPRYIEEAANIGMDRIELYTGPYAEQFENGKKNAVKPYVQAAKKANEVGVGINAGHDLNLDNLHYLYKKIPNLLEVSIGHALVADALYFGFKEAIQRYRQALDK